MCFHRPSDDSLAVDGDNEDKGRDGVLTSEEKGQFASILLQHMDSGRPFNDNQRDMLIELGTNEMESKADIRATLMNCMNSNPPLGALLPGDE